MIYFDSDYMEGAHPEVMRRLVETNLEHTVGYGCDPYTQQAKDAICSACTAPNALVQFLEGGTQTNAGHKTLVPQVIEELKKLGREDIMVIAGGVIPAQDYEYLYKAGVAAIFGPGSPVAKSACTIMELLMAE